MNVIADCNLNELLRDLPRGGASDRTGFASEDSGVGKAMIVQFLDMLPFGIARER